MKTEKRYQSGMGTKGQIDGILSLLKKFNSIAVQVLENRFCFYRSSEQSKESAIYFYNIELQGKEEGLEKYFKALRNEENVFFKELDNFTS